MTGEPIRTSEDSLMVFISTRQDEELARPMTLSIGAADNYPRMKVWAFEGAPASSEAARERYIGNADIVIWLTGSTATTPTAEEISACMQTQGGLPAFKLPADERDCETEAPITKVSGNATWKTVEYVEQLPAHITALPNQASFSRSDREIKDLGKTARKRCKPPVMNQSNGENHSTAWGESIPATTPGQQTKPAQERLPDDLQKLQWAKG